MNGPLIVVDADRVTTDIIKNGKYSRVELTPKEFGLLVLVARAEGRVVTRAQALQTLWSHPTDGSIDTRTVDQHMARLRFKLGSAASAIVTVTNCGYRAVEGAIEVRTSRDMIVHIQKVVGEYRDGQPGYKLSVWMPHVSPAPKAKQRMRLAEVR
jgi:DNA-binding winged helix-turn-helix (wHTH) protein